MIDRRFLNLHNKSTLDVHFACKCSFIESLNKFYEKPQASNKQESFLLHSASKITRLIFQLHSRKILIKTDCWLYKNLFNKKEKKH